MKEGMILLRWINLEGSIDHSSKRASPAFCLPPCRPSGNHRLILNLHSNDHTVPDRLISESPSLEHIDTTIRPSIYDLRPRNVLPLRLYLSGATAETAFD